MPRTSAAAQTGLRAHSSVMLPRPSDELPAKTQQVFRELVAACPAGHFQVSDAPVLEAYAAAAVQLREAERELAASGMVTSDGRVSPWVRIQSNAAKTIASLATRLRLCPQARETSRTAGRHANGSVPSIYSRLGWDEEEREG